MRIRSLLYASLSATLALNVPCAAARAQSASQPSSAPARAEPERFAETQVVSEHELQLPSGRLAYTATAGTLQLREEDGKARASVFFVAYARRDAGDPAARPLTFCFNGGPGSSSVWLHLGAFGPKRVLVDVDALPAPPFELVDNADTLLAHSDLVFIDPVTTGYSRALPGEDASRFHGVTEDVEAVGEFIRLWTTRNERWASPKYLAGESYGTTRAAALAGHLQDRLGMFLNGIVLVSVVLDFQTIRWDAGNDLPPMLYVPSYSATAWYHHRLAPDLQALALPQLLEQSTAFARGPYAAALLAGSALPATRRAEIARELARFSGLAPDFVEACDLRVSDERYCKELLRSAQRTVGRLDSRFTGIDRDSAGEERSYDPSYSAIQGPYTAALNDYLRRELRWRSDLPYEILSGRVQPWHFGPAENRYLNVAETLRAALAKNRHLRVFVAGGYYDFATPWLAAQHTFEHLGLDAEQRGAVELHGYEAGHMMYIRPAVLRALATELAAFYAAGRR